MDLKTITNINEIPSEQRNCTIIGTHNGIFHSDEVVAIAIYCLLYDDTEIRVIRTRNPEILNSCDICIDIGGGKFDHHQPGFSLERKNGIMYASAGLIWKEFGTKLICKYFNCTFSTYIQMADDISKIIDENIISLVDCEDNGIKANPSCFNFIPSFHPLWNDTNPDFDKQFMEALNVTIRILKQVIFQNIAEFVARKNLYSRWKDNRYFYNNILEIPSQTIPWTDVVIQMNDSSASSLELINFVIFEYPNGGWAAQCVPPSINNKFGQRIPFPKEWAGQTENLPKVSGIDEATFCHNGCFFARANTKEAIIKLCKTAMKSI